MKSKYRLGALLIVVAFILSSCRDHSVFSLSPTERSRQSIETLRQELVDAPHGWKVVYFSKMDSLIFSSLSSRVERGYEDEYGVGGHFYHMKFDPSGTVHIRADYDDTTASEAIESEYEVKQNTFTQLSFTTYTYLHQLVNELFSATSDFLYAGKDLDGRLVFRTPSYLETSREYIRFERVQSPEAADTIVAQAVVHRKFFESMRRPQLSIHKGDRVYFDTNFFFRNDDSFADWLKKSMRHRYRVFLYDKSLIPLKEDLIGLGSGYTGTDRGISLYPGLRYSKDFVFRDFERVGDRFVCELVRVYDPMTRQWRYTSRHLAPQGEPTGMIAEISNRNQ